MKKIFILISLTTILISCDFGPKAFLNDDFVLADPSKELPFEKLIGVYQLDKDSKKRYKIPDNMNLSLEIKKDSILYAPNYLNTKNRKLTYEKYENKLFYINNFRASPPITDLSIPKPPFFNGNGSINIYYRKKDSVIALYVFTPFVEATKENNMKYIEGDYLRYIKVK